MAFKDNMQEAAPKKVASSAEYNKIISNVRWVNQVNQNQDAWITQHLGGTPEVDATHDRINSRLDAIESGAGGGGVSDRPILVVAQNASQYPVSGGTNLSFTIVDADSHGMWDNAARTAIIPPDAGGIYEFTFQAVWNSANGGGPNDEASTSGSFGLYVTKDGDSGGANGLAAFEREPIAAPNTYQTVTQVTGNAILQPGNVIRARVYADANSDSYLRGRSNDYSYGGTYFVLRMLQGLPV